MAISIEPLSKTDPTISAAIKQEEDRQARSIELIASENFASAAVLEASGSVLTNKYAEGYAGKRYYSGCAAVDIAENLAIDRAKELFKCSYVNVQPHSGSQANQAVYLALLKPGDTILGMSLDGGGHLTHGAKPNLSGQWFNTISYTVDPETYLINYSEIERLALMHRPKLIIAGYSCYTRVINFAKFREIADKVGAYLLADIAHIAGLVATGAHPSPVPYAHIVTTTTHKTLRGPRGGMIMSDHADIAKMIDKAVFPGLQGGPLMHIVAAKAVAFGEALSIEFEEYINQVIANSRQLARTLILRGYEILTGGTDNHIVILDLSKSHITGKVAADALEQVGITVNKNSIPFDLRSPFVTSGIRLGSPACTTRGFKESEFELVGEMIADILDTLKEPNDQDKMKYIIEQRVIELTNKFPIYN